MKRKEDLITDVQEDGDGGYYVGWKDGSTSRFTQTEVECEDLPCDFCGKCVRDFPADDDEYWRYLNTYGDDRNNIMCSWCISRASKNWREWILKGRDDQERALRETISQDPDDITAHLALADYLEERGRDDAMTDLDIRFHRSFRIDFSSIDEVAKAISQGRITIERIAQTIPGWYLDDGCLVGPCCPWVCSDGDSEDEYDSEDCETAKDAAEEFLDGYDLGDGDHLKTEFVTVYTCRRAIDSDGDLVDIDPDSHTIGIDPPIPPCCDGSKKHRWEDPESITGNSGVSGNGGGVIIQEICMRCGTERITDTWAQNPENGEQGLESVEYSPNKFEGEIAAINEEEDA